ncbi:MAG TPA: hypothetical protein VID76_01165, partial [Solirubrobacterales bacterium]
VATSSSQWLGSTDWLWQSWSDGGALAHSVVAGDLDTEVTALFDTDQTLPAPPPPQPPSPEPETPSCMGVPATYVGTSDAEAIRGGPGDDSIVAGGGGDTIRGRGGDDLICAGAGADELRGGSGADALRGGAGIDTCPNPGADKLRSCR